MIKEPTVIRIRCGIGKTRYCACDNLGNPIQGYNKLSDIRKRYKYAINLGHIVLVRELDKTPYMEGVKQIIKRLDVILKSEAAFYNSKKSEAAF